jgi:hypothetical protein
MKRQYWRAAVGLFAAVIVQDLTGDPALNTWLFEGIAISATSTPMAEYHNPQAIVTAAPALGGGICVYNPSAVISTAAGSTATNRIFSTTAASCVTNQQ